MNIDENIEHLKNVLNRDYSYCKNLKPFGIGDIYKTLKPNIVLSELDSDFKSPEDVAYYVVSIADPNNERGRKPISYNMYESLSNLQDFEYFLSKLYTNGSLKIHYSFNPKSYINSYYHIIEDEKRNLENSKKFAEFNNNNIEHKLFNPFYNNNEVLDFCLLYSGTNSSLSSKSSTFYMLEISYSKNKRYFVLFHVEKNDSYFRVNVYEIIPINKESIKYLIQSIENNKKLGFYGMDAYHDIAVKKKDFLSYLRKLKIKSTPSKTNLIN